MTRGNMKTLKDIFGKLRWKLTLSYMAVTVGALLFVALVIAVPLFTYILSPIDLLDPSYWFSEIYSGKYVTFMREFLIQSPPDEFGAKLLINNLDVLTSSSYEVYRIKDVSLSMIASPQLEGAVVDADGSLIGVTAGDLADTAYNLSDFKSRAYPEINSLMRAALSGETDPEALSVVRDEDQTLIIVVPVYEWANDLQVIPGDRILGAIILVVKSLPAQEFLPTYVLRLVGAGMGWFLIAAGIMGALFGFLTARYFEVRFRKLYVAADQWSRGEFSRLVDDQSTDELGELARRMDQMAIQLQDYLAQRQELAISGERNRLARELHDSAKQQSLVAAFRLGTAIELIEKDPSKAVDHLLQAETAVDNVRQELTDLIHELRPPRIEEDDLGDAIKTYATEWAYRNNVDLSIEVERFSEYSLELKLALYRILQEALANIARHSQARMTQISLKVQNSQIYMVITDDGIGFDPDLPPRGLGLQSMGERVGALKGRFEIRSQPGEGTKIIIQVPLEDM
jgi:signal transduction histidine kinase